MQSLERKFGKSCSFGLLCMYFRRRLIISVCMLFFSFWFLGWPVRFDCIFSYLTLNYLVYDEACFSSIKSQVASR